jgi:hypothetical protein
MNTESEKDQIIQTDVNKLPESHSHEVKKKNPLMFIIPGIIALVLVGFFVVRAFGGTKIENKIVNEDPEIEEVLKEVDSSVEVDLVKSKSKDNTVVIRVKGLSSRFVSIGYELQYESGGVGKGVTSGSKPLDVTGQDTFEREIYLGTCSKNVCKPDLGVSKVGLVLEFTDTTTTRTQFSKEFDL